MGSNDERFSFQPGSSHNHHRPKSLITDRGLFPGNAVVWEINYRGELGFWQQAKSQEEQRNLTVEDGWLYFLHGWTEVIVEVLDIKLDDALF